MSLALSSLLTLDVFTESEMDHKLFRATYILYSKKKLANKGTSFMYILLILFRDLFERENEFTSKIPVSYSSFLCHSYIRSRK